MSVIATCGHKLTAKENLGTTIYVKSSSRDGSRAIDYTTLCNACLKSYRKRGLELKTKRERDKWLGISKTKKPKHSAQVFPFEKEIKGTNVNSVYTLCLNCKTWGINFPLNKECGDCRDPEGLTYYDAETIHNYLKNKKSLPTDNEVKKWFGENINKDCSASSAIYKFRLWLKHGK